MAEDWSKKEVRLIVEDYFNMLRSDLVNEPYNKTAHRNELLPKLNNRTKGAIEFKHQNISAALSKMGLPYIKGYKFMHRYQHLIDDEIVAYFLKNKGVFEPAFSQFSMAAPEQKPISKINFEQVLDKEPVISHVHENDDDVSFFPLKINYLEKEQNNRSLGDSGEELVVDYEKWRLKTAGRKALAESVEWSSKERGDGLGYDILSKNTNGTDRFIEVKTTKLSKESPIYITRKEMKFSAINTNNFYLYRVFNFDTKPQIFIKQGRYQDFCFLEPQTYKGYF